MKKILLGCILSFITLSTYAETCPEAPGGYEFRVAAWGDHAKNVDKVRCHYYFYRDQTQHIEISTGGLVDERAFKGHPEWYTSDRYSLCSSHTKNVNDCPFGNP